MEEQERFLELLREIKGIAALQQDQLTKEEIKHYLDGMELDDDKIDAVCRYLSTEGIGIDGYIPDRPSYNRKLYQQEAGRLSNLDNGIINGIIKDFLMGGKDARDRLAESKLSHVIQLASAYKNHVAVADKTISMDEIIAEGNLGLLTGIAVIEENRSQYFMEDGIPDYEAVHGIINMEIVNAMERMIDTVSGNKDQENTILAKANLLHEASKHLAGETGRIPSKEELSGYTNVSVREISNIIDLSEDTKRVVSSGNKI